LVCPCDIRKGNFLKIFRWDVCRLRYGCKHASSLHISGNSACMHILKSVNFVFFQHPKILHSLKAITDYWNVHAYLCGLHACAYKYHSQMFFGLSLMPTWISYQLLSKSKVIWWRNWCVYIAQSVCMFYMHVFNWWDQFENMCKFGWEIMWQTDSVTE